MLCMGILEKEIRLNLNSLDIWEFITKEKPGGIGLSTKRQRGIFVKLTSYNSC